MLKGTTHTRQTKEKMKNHIFTKQHKYNLSLAKQGKKRTQETKRKISIANRGSKNFFWKGGKVKQHGYIFIHKPDHPFCDCKGYVREHRLVIEKQIGHYLLPSEKCHHFGKKDDNRPHMLMAFISHSVHLRFANPNNVKPNEIIFDGRKLLKCCGCGKWVKSVHHVDCCGRYFGDCCDDFVIPINLVKGEEISHCRFCLDRKTV